MHIWARRKRCGLADVVREVAEVLGQVRGVYGGNVQVEVECSSSDWSELVGEPGDELGNLGGGVIVGAKYESGYAEGRYVVYVVEGGYFAESSATLRPLRFVAVDAGDRTLNVFVKHNYYGNKSGVNPFFRVELVSTARSVAELAREFVESLGAIGDVVREYVDNYAVLTRHVVPSAVVSARNIKEGLRRALEALRGEVKEVADRLNRVVKSVADVIAQIYEQAELSTIGVRLVGTYCISRFPIPAPIMVVAPSNEPGRYVINYVELADFYYESDGECGKELNTFAEFEYRKRRIVVRVDFADAEVRNGEVFIGYVTTRTIHYKGRDDVLEIRRRCTSDTCRNEIPLLATSLLSKVSYIEIGRFAARPAE